MKALILNIIQYNTKAGKPFVVLDLFTDKKEKINAKIWETTKEGLPLKNHQIIEVDFQVGEYNGRPSYTINHYTVVDDKNIDRSMFTPSLPAEKINEMAAQLDKYIATIEMPKYKQIVTAFMTDHRDKYIKWPSAKSMHGNYLGGLLEHSLAVCNLAQAMADEYPNKAHYNRDLLVAGALLHDIGKIFTYSFESGGIDYVKEEKLLGHSLIGCSVISKYAGKLKMQFYDLMHIVASHMGRVEWGAITTPKMLEALFVSQSDLIDSKTNVYYNESVNWEDGKTFANSENDFIYRSEGL